MSDKRLEWITADPPIFRMGPGEFLAYQVVQGLKAVPQFKALFGDSIDEYEKEDYSLRALPALRIYNESYFKEFESWFITGDLTADIIYPASLRRKELQRIPMAITTALLQQFRRPEFFRELEVLVPGLNELGRAFNVDNSLAFTWKDGVTPMTQLKINFRLDLRQWDAYLISQGLTKDSPFEEVLGDLTRIAGIIQGIRDNEAVEVNLGFDTDELRGIE